MEAIDLSGVPLVRVYTNGGMSQYTYAVPCAEADTETTVTYSLQTVRVSPNQVFVQPHYHDGVLKPCGFLSELVTARVHREYERLLKRYIYLEES